MIYLRRTSLLIFCLLAHFAAAVRHCIWQTALRPHNQPQTIDTLQPPTSIIPYIVRVAESNKNQLPDHVLSLMLKESQIFRSYHPHYLHSYSYPIPITPHFFFGQVSRSSKRPVFQVRDNDTLSGEDVSEQMFYINGVRSGSQSSLLQSEIRKVRDEEIQLMLVVQIENMISLPVETTLQINNFGHYLGAMCFLGSNIIKSFIIYLIEDGQNPVSFSNLPQGLAISFREDKRQNNLNAWKTGHDLRWDSAFEVQLPVGILVKLNSLVLQLKYSSILQARKIKICIKEIPSAGGVVDIAKAVSSINLNEPEYHIQTSKKSQAMECGSQAQKQLLEGLSYEYGTLELRNGSRVLKNEAKELLSFSPSRKRFPWGFLWDDGFHCEVAIRKDPQLALEVLKSWLDTITETGWIPREQNRGPQRQKLCSCPRFMAKDIRDGNPPTLIFSLHYLAKQRVLKESFSLVYYEKLKKWYNWFMQTQQSEPGSYVFRWHDSIFNDGSFNSGLDDFPRLAETTGHIDCQSWMAMFSEAMADIAAGLDKDPTPFHQNYAKIKEKLLSEFIDPASNLPKDFTQNYDGSKAFSPHFGYPSILPVAFGLFAGSSASYNATLTAIQSQLDSGFGLTSLSMKSPLYLATKDAYWRGPVWININYLMLRGLSIYYPNELDYYNKLRKDIVGLVCKNLQRKGYFFENYIRGEGSFSFPFTGWTALIAIIIKQNY